jgi:hypothetical protein
MASPLVQQGTINRLRGSVSFPSFPVLNIQAFNLMKAGISLTFEDNATLMIDTMTGMVTSPEPYLPCTVTLRLLRTQALGAAWRSQIESISVIGDFSVVSDTSIWTPYNLINGGITRQGDISLAGDDPGYMISIQATYPINNDLWNVA